MTRSPPRLLITAGDPAGIGPDICVALATREFPAALAVLGDDRVLAARARQLGIDVELVNLDSTEMPPTHRPGRLAVVARHAPAAVVAGQPDRANAAHVLDGLAVAVRACLDGHYDAVVTAPVSKATLTSRERPFSGHTEFLAAAAGAPTPVMMLCAGTLRVAQATTHLPLRAVPDAITPARLRAVIGVLHGDLARRFGIADPRILVCGLNPHAGESGELGHEEIEVIEPTLHELRRDGLRITGPLPADTLFLPRHLQNADAVLAMYHDQGLPVLKYAGFGQAVNVTLGLPFVRTSVDHGTAFDLAGSGQADPGSLYAAVEMAIRLTSGAAPAP